MTKITLTDLEKSALNWIGFAEHGSYNGWYPDTNDCNPWCWADEIADHAGTTTKAIRGTLSSLIKKQLIVITDPGHEDSSVYFTDLGYDVFTETFPKAEWAKEEIAIWKNVEGQEWRIKSLEKILETF